MHPRRTQGNLPPKAMETHNFEIQRLFRVKENWAEKLGGLFR